MGSGLEARSWDERRPERPSEEEALIRRAAETEYATLDPRYAQDVAHGTFYAHPDFGDRYDANQLCRVSCGVSELDAMLAELRGCYAGLGLDFIKVSGYDAEAWSDLDPALRSRGWSVYTSMLMLDSSPSRRSSNPDVRIRVVDPGSTDLESLYTEQGRLDRGFELARSQALRLGGEYLVGYLDGRPACCTGWYVADGVARFRHVLTAVWARRRGCATSLIHHVQSHPTVEEQDGLAIMSTTEGPVELYHELGFREVCTFWEAKVQA